FPHVVFNRTYQPQCHCRFPGSVFEKCGCSLCLRRWNTHGIWCIDCRDGWIDQSVGRNHHGYHHYGCSGFVDDNVSIGSPAHREEKTKACDEKSSSPTEILGRCYVT